MIKQNKQKSRIFLFTLLFLFLCSYTVNAAVSKNLHGYNGTDWIPISVDGSGNLEMNANISTVSWNNILDIPSGFNDNIDNSGPTVWQQGVDSIYNSTTGFSLGIGIIPTSNLHVIGDANITTNLTVVDSILTDYIYPNNNLVTQIKNLSIINDLRVTGNSYLGTLVFDANGTFPDSVLTDYIFPQSSGTTTVDNITILKDIRVLGNSYLGSFTIEDDLVIGSNNISSTDIILNGGNVGIGTTSPTSPSAHAGAVLHIEGESPVIHLEDTSQGDFEIVNENGVFRISNISAGNEDGFRILSSENNVGIGDATPDAMLEIGEFGITPFMISDGSAGDGNFFIVDTSGNVGIGTTSPGTSTKLNVAGRGLFTGGTHDPDDGTAAGISLSFEDNVGIIRAVQTGIASHNLVLQPTAGNVGIGTTSPTHTLNVDGDLNVTGDAFLGSFTLQDDLIIGSNNISSTRMGIGTTSPGYKLHVDNGVPTGNLAYFLGNNGNDGLLFGTTTTPTPRHFYLATGGGSTGLSFGINGDSNAMFIDTSGNVGIGTTSPEQPLHISGSAAAQIKLTEEDTWKNWTIGAGTGGNSLFGFSDGTMRMAIDGTTGNIGIGTTTPSAKLDIESDSDEPALNVSGVVRDGTDYLATFHNRAENDNALGVKILHATRAVSNDAFVVGTDSATSFKVGYDGNVGIGTATPASTLEVNGILTTADRIHATNAIGSTGELGKFINSSIIIDNSVAANDYSQIAFGYTRSWNNIYANAAIAYLPTTTAGYGAGALLFATRTVTTDTQPTERMRIDEDGNVGIGTAIPDQRLVVNASAQGVIANFVDNSNRGVSLQSGSRGGIVSLMASNEDLDFTTAGSGDFIFNNGKVGIGTTNPTNTLDVVGGIMSNSSLSAATINGIAMSQESDHSRLMAFGPDGSTAGSMRLTVGESDGGGQIEAITITNIGNVGIGTTTPYGPLSLSSSYLNNGSTGDSFLPTFEIAKFTVKDANSGTLTEPGSNTDSALSLNSTEIFLIALGSVGSYAVEPDEAIASIGLQAPTGYSVKARVVWIGDSTQSGDKAGTPINMTIRTPSDGQTNFTWEPQGYDHGAYSARYIGFSPWKTLDTTHLVGRNNLNDMFISVREDSDYNMTYTRMEVQVAYVANY